MEKTLWVALLFTGHFTLVVPALTKKKILRNFFSCLLLGTYERKKTQFQTLLATTYVVDVSILSPNMIIIQLKYCS